MRREVFVGVGVDHYDSAELADLDYAVADVEAVAQALTPPFDGEPLTDADVAGVNKCLLSLKDRADGGTLVMMWSGHGTDLGGLRLATADQVDGVAASEVIRGCVLSGASQLLLVIDTCQAGAVLDSVAMARRLLQQIPPSAGRVWLGILVSCSAADIGARDGAFGRLLVKLLTEGPDSADQQRRWSKHNDRILGEDLGLALLEEWPGIDQRPEFLKNGHPLAILPNPLYDDGAPEEVVEHLLRAARGGDPGDEQSWFTGRTAEVDTVVSWVRAGDVGVRVVVGSAGTGKSAVVGRVVSLSNPHERDRLQRGDEGWGHDDPGVRSVAAHVHARGLTVERIAELLEWQLIRAQVLEPITGGRRNAAELLGTVQRVVEGGIAAPVVVIDGLDEARGQAFVIAEDLLARLAPFATVVISTRPLTHQDGSELLDTLAPVAVLDLDSEECQESAQSAISAYVRKRLTGVDSAMDASAVAAHLAGEALVTVDRPFLLARVITDQLRARPVSTVVPEWSDRIAHSIEDAFDADLARVEPPPARNLGAPATRQLARTMLIALTWALGAGFPEPEWLTVASALAETNLGREDVSWVVDQLGRYVVQDGDAGVAVYRLAHQSFADHLRAPYRPTGQHPFNPAALPVGVALLEQYNRLLADGVPAQTPAYLWRYAWVHAANAGFEGLTRLRAVAHTRTELQADVAMAALQIADTAAAWGRRGEAVAPTEEAVAHYRVLAEENPAYLPDLATALNSLGIRYSEVGRRGEAVAPTEEAVAHYRVLAEENPAYLPDLAAALNSLGIRYSEVGRRGEAVAPTEEAVTLRRVLAEENPAYLPNLAAALNNLGACYSEVGRRGEAVAPTEEAVAHYRVLAEENPAYLPDLAMALNNLSSQLAATNGRDAADVVWEDVVAAAGVRTRPSLLLYRAQYAQTGDPRTAPWLHEVIQDGRSDLLAAAHSTARRHWVANPESWEQAWTAIGHSPLPPWLVVDPDMLAVASDWIATASYEDERDYLAAHPELLDDTFDVAVEEAVLDLPEAEASRYTELRAAAQSDGTVAAYRPLLLAVLAQRFAFAEPKQQQRLLTDRRPDLLDDLSLAHLSTLADDAEDDSRPAVALALLHLAGATPDDDLAEVFAALDNTGDFAALLYTAASDPDVTIMRSLAVIALHAARTAADASDARFHLAVAAAIEGTDTAPALLGQAITPDSPNSARPTATS